MKAKLNWGESMVEIEGTPAELRELLQVSPGPGNTQEFEIPKCRVCGCTDDNACEGGCSWVAPDLCSSCASKAEAEGPLRKEGETVPCASAPQKPAKSALKQLVVAKKSRNSNLELSKKKCRICKEKSDLARCKLCGKERNKEELERGKCKLGCKPLTKEEENYETPGALDAVSDYLGDPPSAFIGALLEKKTKESEILMEIRARAKASGFVITEKTAKKIYNKAKSEDD